MIIGSMVVKNEADKYLQASLTQLMSVCDKVFVADDQSEDDSVKIAKDLGCKVWIRPKDVPSFIDDESAFRQAAWDQMAKTVRANDQDWIVSVDSDEYLDATKDQFKELSIIAGLRTAFIIPRFEIWDFESQYYRIDGFWNTIMNKRIHKYTNDIPFRKAKMGGGSVPNTSPATEIHKMSILHFGYAMEEDRQKKYDFYKLLVDHGHNDKHIDSILTKPELHSPKKYVDFWRGVK